MVMRIHTALTHGQLKSLGKGLATSISDDDDIEGGKIPCRCKFSTKKKFQQFARNAAKGKKTRVKLSDMDEFHVQSEGGGFMDFLKKTVDVGKKIADSKITKGVVGALAPAAGDMIGKLSGNDTAGQIATSGLKMYSKSGSGFFDTLKAVGNSSITKGLVKAAAPSIVNAIGARTGNVGQSLTQGALNAYTGSGIPKGRAKRAGEAKDVQFPGHESTEFSSPMHERMHKLRQMRKKGGSFRPL
jgi:hypothetical protein